MKLQGISINVVRNEYEYNEHVSEEYRKQYDYEASKASLPWIIINFEKGNSLGDEVSKSILTLEPTADFTNISAASNGEWSVGSDKSKLNVNLEKIPNMLMLESKKDCGFTTLPTAIEATVVDNSGNIFTAETESIDLSNTEEILENIDKKCIKQGDGYLAKLIYELIAAGRI